MSGPKAKPSTIFDRIQAELIRLQSLCDTPQQHDIHRQLVAVVNKVRPLWTDQPFSLPTRRTSPREREQAYNDAQVRAMNGQPLPKPSREQYLRWHEADPDNFPLPPDDNLT